MTKKEIKRTWNGRSVTGTAEILIATLVWGYGYIVIRDSVSEIPPNVLMTWRYLIAFVVLLLLFRRHMKKMSGKLLREGAVLGGLLYFSQYFQTKALACSDTTAGKVAFITALYVVFVPFLNWIVLKKRPTVRCILAIGLALPGLYLLTCSGEMGLGTGDMLALVGSLGFSVHILAIDSFTAKDDVIALTILQFGSAFVYAAVMQLISQEQLSGGMGSFSVWWPLIYLGIFSTMLGFLMQLLGQTKLSPEVSAVLLSTESVFGMLFSVWLLDERLTGRGILGCTLMFGAILLAEQKGDSE